MATKTIEPLEALLDDETVSPADDVRDAIAAYFYELPNRVDIRPLWNTPQGCCYRVNFWGSDPETGANRIGRSAFVTVEDARSGLIVRDMTFRRVA